jgi:hypothetical protein
MSSIELQELQEFWDKKYPHIFFTLWEDPTNERYLGKIRMQNSCQDLSASSIGELISQGEAYLRMVT